MKKNNLLHLFLLSSFLFFSCNSKLPFDETNTVALTGYVSAEKGVSILLSKALPATQEYYFDKTDFFINNATVRLFEERKELFLLHAKGNGDYGYSDTLWKPTVGKKYSIQATIPDYGVVESTLVTFPPPPRIAKFSYTIKRDTSSKEGDGILSLDFEKKEVLGNTTQYYEITNTATLNNLLLISDPPTKNPNLTEQESMSCGHLYYGSYSYFTSNCLKNNIFYHILKLLGRDVAGIRHLYNKLDMRVYSISEEQHKFMAAQVAQDQTDERFQEIPPSYTNIKNGIGCFYARNEGKEVFVVKP